MKVLKRNEVIQKGDICLYRDGGYHDTAASPGWAGNTPDGIGEAYIIRMAGKELEDYKSTHKLTKNQMMLIEYCDGKL